MGRAMRSGQQVGRALVIPFQIGPAPGPSALKMTNAPEVSSRPSVSEWRDLPSDGHPEAEQQPAGCWVEREIFRLRFAPLKMTVLGQRCHSMGNRRGAA